MSRQVRSLNCKLATECIMALLCSHGKHMVVPYGLLPMIPGILPKSAWGFCEFLPDLQATEQNLFHVNQSSSFRITA